MSRLFKNIDSEESFGKLFEQGTRLGGGAFADVYQVVCRDNRKVVAVIKRVNLEIINYRAQDYPKREVVLYFVLISLESPKSIIELG